MGLIDFQTETLEHGPNFMVGRTSRYARKRLTLRIDPLPAEAIGLRMLHLTDLHCTHRWQPAYDRLHAQVAENRPDLILLTGDFVDDRCDHRAALPVLRRLLGGLTARLGTFGIAGNHDTDLLLPKLGDLGATLLQNQGVEVGGIELVGLAGVRRREVSRAWIEQLPIPADRPRVLLTHYPDTVKYLGTLGATLVLAGHTHGGQVCFPGGRPLFTHDALGRPFHRDAHRIADPTGGTGDACLLIGAGLGCSTHHLRTFCPPEVWEVEMSGS